MPLVLVSIGYGEILLQINKENKDEIVRFISGTWNPAQKNYSTIKKEILAIVLVFKNFN